MKNLLMLAAFALGTLAAAQSPTWQGLLTPDAATLNTACTDGYRIESMPQTTEEQKAAYAKAYWDVMTGRTLLDRRTFLPSTVSAGERLQAEYRLAVSVQMPAGGAYNICGRFAGELKPQPDASTLKPSLLVLVNGIAAQRADAERWNAVIALLDGEGKELARFSPTRADRGRIQDFKPSCTASGPCRWLGENAYYFSLPAVPAQTATLRLFLTRGQGVEQRDYTLADFQKTTLTDPR